MSGFIIFYYFKRGYGSLNGWMKKINDLEHKEKKNYKRNKKIINSTDSGLTNCMGKDNKNNQNECVKVIIITLIMSVLKNHFTMRFLYMYNECMYVCIYICVYMYERLYVYGVFDINWLQSRKDPEQNDFL